MAGDSSQLRPEVEKRRPHDRLDSWKEIADYLGREPRTVQRWEKSKGLPIRRLAPDSPDEQPRVFAYESEIDAWWHERETNIKDEVEDDSDLDAGTPLTEVVVLEDDDGDFSGKKRVPRFRVLLYILVLSAIVIAAFTIWYSMHPLLPKVLAVVPFVNSTGDPQTRDIARALTDEMISRLGQLHPEQLTVIELTPSDSDLPPDRIGRKYKADYILKGAARRADQQIGITAQLISVKPKTIVWGLSEKSDMRDVIDSEIKVADTIATQVLGVLPHSSLPAHQVSHETYEAYLTGRALWNRRTTESLNDALTYFQQAIKSDPMYAPAYAGLAECYSLLGSAPYTAQPPKEAFPQAKAAARQALMIDDSLAEAHLSLGYAELVYDWNFPEAEKEFRRALELRPSSATAHQYYAYYLTAIGELDRAIDERKQAQELEPDSPLLNSALGEAYYQAREYDLTIAQNKKSLVLDPRYAIALINIGRAYEQKAMYPEALKAFRTVAAVVPNDPALIALIGHTYAVSGKPAEARAAIAQLQQMSTQRYVPSLYVALIYTGLNERAQAFTWLQKAYEERCEYLVYLPAEPQSDPLRRDPRFSRLLKQIGLPVPKPLVPR